MPYSVNNVELPSMNFVVVCHPGMDEQEIMEVHGLYSDAECALEEYEEERPDLKWDIMALVGGKFSPSGEYLSGGRLTTEF